MAPHLQWFAGWRRPQRSGRDRRRPARQSIRLVVEVLEDRTVLAALMPGDAAGIVGVPVSHDASQVSFPLHIPLAAAATPSGFSPAQIRHAYGFDQVMFGTVTGDGAGQTIAIVDAFNHPNIASDLHTFDVTFGLPDPSFTKYWQVEGGQPPRDDAGWALEIALDVEWAHAIAPAASIMLVEAFDNSDTNLFASVAWAAQQPGVSAISMSFGGSEWSGQTSYDVDFQTPAGHQGVTFIAASGDRASGGWYSLTNPFPIYPAASPNVVGVGGTSLFLDPSGNYGAESAWDGSGGGISGVESQPGYQQGVVPQSSTRRVSPDVAFVADPFTGVAVYDSYASGGDPWFVVGGTSASSPIFAGLMAMVNQGRALRGVTSLDGATQTLPAIYTMASLFRDITSGGPPVYPAIPGYDASTGFGTPVATSLVPALASYGTAQHEANMNFVAAAFMDILGRAADSPSQIHFALQLDAGTPRSSVVSVIDHSAEYFGNIIVTPAYQQFLGRAPDAAGLSYWVSLMQFNGLTDEQLEANFIASDEFYAHAGGTNVAWVDAMYVDLLGRPPDAQGEAYWVQQLALGVSRYTVAYGFAASLEREQQRITDDYMHYLGRQPDAQGLNYWLNLFAAGATNEDLITGIVSSNEYYAEHSV